MTLQEESIEPVKSWGPGVAVAGHALATSSERQKKPFVRTMEFESRYLKLARGGDYCGDPAACYPVCARNREKMLAPTAKLSPPGLRSGSIVVYWLSDRLDVSNC